MPLYTWHVEFCDDSREQGKQRKTEGEPRGQMNKQKINAIRKERNQCRNRFWKLDTRGNRPVSQTEHGHR